MQFKVSQLSEDEPLSILVYCSSLLDNNNNRAYILSFLVLHLFPVPDVKSIGVPLCPLPPLYFYYSILIPPLSLPPVLVFLESIASYFFFL